MGKGEDLTFIMVMELVSRRVTLKGILRRMLYMDDPAVVAESRKTGNARSTGGVKEGI